MAVLSAVIVPTKITKDGKHKVRIAVSHKSVTTYIVTNILLDSVSEFSNGRVVRRTDAGKKNVQLRELLNSYQERLDSISNIDLLTSKQIKELIKSGSTGSGTSSLQSVSADYCVQLRKEKRESYARLLEYATRCFTSFIGEDYPLSAITPELIQSFREYLHKNTKQSDAIIDTNICRIRTIVNRAVKQHLVSYPYSPFSEIELHIEQIKECDLPVEVMQQIIQCSPHRHSLIVARDMLLLSFYLGGANFRDILDIDFRKDTVEYYRNKTKRATRGQFVVKFSLHEKAKAIASKYMQKNGQIDLGYNYKDYNGLMSYVCEKIKDLGKWLKLDDRLVYYSARKSFAQYAMDLGIPDSITDYIIGHAPSKRGMLKFYSKARQKQADIAMQRVFDYVDNPDSYKDYIEMRADIMLLRDI